MLRKILLALLVILAMLPCTTGLADETYAIDEEKGLWQYQNEYAKIRIIRKTDESIPLIWFEAELWLSPESPLVAVTKHPKKPGSSFHNPEDLARANRLVFAVNDDYYGDRRYNRETIGIVIRDGKVISYGTFKNGNRAFPNLDTMAFYPNGTLKVYQSKELTSSQYIELGATDVFAFGPILVRDGVVNPRLAEEYRVNEPRVGFGIIEPFHYLCVVTEGRHEGSKGVSCEWLAEKLLELGAQEALNLDGGQTAALVFMGTKINQTGTFNNRQRIRNISSMIGACKSEVVPE